jgi:hypothetical protein
MQPRLVSLRQVQPQSKATHGKDFCGGSPGVIMEVSSREVACWFHNIDEVMRNACGYVKR